VAAAAVQRRVSSIRQRRDIVLRMLVGEQLEGSMSDVGMLWRTEMRDCGSIEIRTMRREGFEIGLIVCRDDYFTSI
jgi:hypothetical protein